MQEEEKRSKLPANWEAKRRRVEWELMDQKTREEAEKEGKNYDIVKNMGTLYCNVVIVVGFYHFFLLFSRGSPIAFQVLICPSVPLLISWF